MATLVFLANTKVAHAEDYEVVFYSASENPISGSYASSRVTGVSLDDAYLNTLDKYGYVDFLVSVRVQYNFSGVPAGCAFRYRPYGYLVFSLASTPVLTGFQYDQIFLRNFNWRGYLTEVEINCTSTSSTPVYNYPFALSFLFNWCDVDPGAVYIDIDFGVRLYANDASSVDLYSLGQTTLGPPTIGATSSSYQKTFHQTGAYIANFSMYSGLASQFNNSSLMAGYLYDIREALAPSSPPDPEVQALEDAVDDADDQASEAESLESAVFDDIDQDSIDDAFDQIDSIFDTDLFVGVDFWKRWLNQHYEIGVYNGEHYGTFIEMVTNMIARLWH